MKFAVLLKSGFDYRLRAGRVRSISLSRDEVLVATNKRVLRFAASDFRGLRIIGERELDLILPAELMAALSKYGRIEILEIGINGDASVKKYQALDPPAPLPPIRRPPPKKDVPPKSKPRDDAGGEPQK
ncbi:MAG TPA: hypothetical protein VME17_18245 [Bryobacteraceae bacterium]|nr:hypothetical protein [Bryobacteraceae bacterium]